MNEKLTTTLTVRVSAAEAALIKAAATAEGRTLSNYARRAALRAARATAA